MNVERYLRLIAGEFAMCGLASGYYVNPHGLVHGWKKVPQELNGLPLLGQLGLATQNWHATEATPPWQLCP